MLFMHKRLESRIYFRSKIVNNKVDKKKNLSSNETRILVSILTIFLKLNIHSVSSSAYAKVPWRKKEFVNFVNLH